MTKMSSISANTARNVQRSFNLITVAATTMATTIAASLSAAVVEAESFAFSIQKSAQIVGTTSEMFSKLAYSAKMAGVPMDTLKMAMERVSRTAGSAQSGNKEAISVYQALGISVKDLSGPLKDSGDLTVALAKKINSYKDSTNKTALEQKLFGRSGAELAPLLKQLAEQFEASSKQAELFGVVVGDKASQQAVKFHQSMMQLESIALGFSLRLMDGVAPALQQVGDKIIGFITSANGMQAVDTIASGIAASITVMGNALVFAMRHANELKTAVELFIALRVGTTLLDIGSTAGTSALFVDRLAIAFGRTTKAMLGFNAITFASTLNASAAGALGLAQAFTIVARTEGTVAAVTMALDLAWSKLNATMIKNPSVIALGLLAAGAYVFYKALTDDVAASTKLNDAAVTFADYWAAAIDQTKDRLGELKTILTTFSDKDRNAAMDKWAKDPSFGDRVHQEANQRQASMPKPKPDAVDTNAGKIDAPPLPSPKAEKIDIVAKKLTELRDAAAAAHQSLMDAGKGVDFERADEAAKDSKRIIDDLNVALKAKGKALTEGEKAEIIAATASRVNDESQAKFLEDLLKTTEGLQAQADAQDILTRAVGQGAEAVRNAALASEALKENSGKSAEWMQKNADAVAKRDALKGSLFDKSNQDADAKTLGNIQEQIDAQLRLNAAIMGGKDARDAASLASQQDAIFKSHADRGDTNLTSLTQELEANQRLFDLKQKQADIERAYSMDPAKAYRDEIKAIQDAQEAAKELGMDLDTTQVAAANKSAWTQYQESVDKAVLAVGSASDGVRLFFNQMSRDTVSAAQQVKEVLTGTFDSLNGVLTQFVTLHTHNMHEFTRQIKNDFADMFRGIAASIAKVGLQKIEQAGAGAVMGALGMGDNTKGGVLGALGIGTKVDPTTTAVEKTNGILIQMLARLNTMSAMTGSGTATGWQGVPFTDPSAGDSSGSGGGGGFIQGALGLLGTAATYGGGFALGGDVMAGVTYDVGEMGREKFTPTQNGRITPNHDLKGNTAITIDARGSNDPAQTEAAIHRAMSQYGPVIAQGAMRGMKEQQQRAPSSRPRA